MMPHPSACLMIQGTGSDTGKSIITAGLARLFRNQGFATIPFKPQNMSNNAAVTADGGEIGRAQAFQAFAAGIAPSKYMNPILLKPEGGHGSQLVVNGHYQGHIKARDYYKRKAELLKIVLDSYHMLAAQADVMLIEGAGSPAEVNLRAADIANMGFASQINAPVILVADINRGGVLASLVGTYELLLPSERNLIKGYIINQFRGEEALFKDALTIIAQHTGWQCLGIVPFADEVKWFADEDSMILRSRYRQNQSTSPAQNNIVQKDIAQTNIALLQFDRIANADDFTPLAQDARINIISVPLDEPLPMVDWVILPGSKNTLADMKKLHASGMVHDLWAHLRRGGKILGICGGYQMLGELICDPEQIEGTDNEVQGLGLLPIHTILRADKTLKEFSGQAYLSGKYRDHPPIAIKGYEIHLGQTRPSNTHQPQQHWIESASPQHLIATRSGQGDLFPEQIFGCYLHGLFSSQEFYERFFELQNHNADDANVENITAAGQGDWLTRKSDDALDEFSVRLSQVLDMAKIVTIAGLG